MTFPNFPPHMLRPTTPLSGGTPEPAPPGTLFAIGDQHGWAVPPRRFTLHFGRQEDDVHVPLGTDDEYISRYHGLFTCDGETWWLENRGKLPIQVPDGPMLLRGHGRAMRSGYTPLMIFSQRRRTHVLHVRVVGYERPAEHPYPTAESPTRQPDLFTLSRSEHLAMAALAHRYLRGEPHPQPATWKQAAQMLSAIPDGRQWPARSVETLVAALRDRLAIPFTSREEVNEPVGNTLNHNLIEALLRGAYLLPEDLAQFDGPVDSARG
jgi:hypothetical protein